MEAGEPETAECSSRASPAGPKKTSQKGRALPRGARRRTSKRDREGEQERSAAERQIGSRAELERENEKTKGFYGQSLLNELQIKGPRIN